MYQPSNIIISAVTPLLSEADLNRTISSKAVYEKKLANWQKKMLLVQQAYFRQNKRAIIVFEGWDASGKGGAIRRLTEKLDPRGFRVYPIGPPTKDEQGRHYLYRFQKKLPKLGTIAIFDRSYYGRVLVERVEGFASDHQWQRAYSEINEFERLLSDDDVRIIKVFLHIDKGEQLRRFEERLNNPNKRWKLTEEDIRNREKWHDYEIAIDDMFSQTSTEQSPWHLISGNHKWRARVDVIKTITTQLAEGVDVEPPEVDHAIVDLAQQRLGIIAR